MTWLRYALFLSLVAFVVPFVVQAAPIPVPTGYPSFSFQNTSMASDIYNGTYTKYWLFNLTRTARIDIYGMAYGMMAPILAVMGYWIFLIIWLTYLATVWMRSQDLTLPLVIGLISASVWGVLIPAEAYLYIGVMFAICIAVILVKLVWSP
jgi:hypothetical protein